MKQKRIVTIQDLSCFGKCSLGVAMPVISAFGIETVVLPTAILSTHTGEFENYTFHDLTEEFPKISKHWESLNIEFDAIYVGYLGSIQQIELVTDFLRKFKKEDTVVFIDPVMADNGKLYNGFTEEFVIKMRELCKEADIICPNITEASFLAGVEYRESNVDREYIKNLLEKLSLICPSVVLTSVDYEQGQCGAVAFEDKTIKEAFKEHFKGHFYGAGDLFASTFIGEYVSSKDFEKALNFAAEFVSKSIENTLDEREKYWYGLKFEQCLDIITRREI